MDVHEKVSVEEAVLREAMALDDVESLRESRPGATVQAEAEVINGKRLAGSRNSLSDLETDSKRTELPPPP